MLYIYIRILNKWSFYLHYLLFIIYYLSLSHNQINGFDRNNV